MDHLGSPRVVTDAVGAVVGRKDFSAYGEEMSTPQRVQNLGYQPVNVRQSYTGYLKDEESGLEFAEARYYNPLHGRFTSVDPLTASATIRNPQTFNRYAYALNSPYKFTDPLGLIPSTTGACGQWCQNYASDQWGGSAEFDTLAGAPPIWPFIYEVTRQTTITYRGENGQLYRQRLTDVWYENSYGAYLGRKRSGEGNDSSQNGNGRTSSPRDDSRISEDPTFSPPQDRLVGPFVLPGDILNDLVAGNLPSQGNGDCAQLPQVLLGGQMGLTREWVAGKNVIDYPDGPPRGTVIATMQNGRYPGKSTGNHVAIFLAFIYDDARIMGMLVINQWKGLKAPKISRIPLPPPNTRMPDVPSAAAIRDMRTYFVVYRRVRN